MSSLPVNLSARSLSTGYGSRLVINELDLELPGGEFTVIVGPNACGKSTLLRTLARLLAPQAGSVLIDGSDIHSIATKALARRMGILPQSPLVPEGVTVATLPGADCAAAGEQLVLPGASEPDWGPASAAKPAVKAKKAKKKPKKASGRRP